MSDEASLEELVLLLEGLTREFGQTIDAQHRKDIATEISELTLRIRSLRDRAPQKLG